MALSNEVRAFLHGMQAAIKDLEAGREDAVYGVMQAASNDPFMVGKDARSWTAFGQGYALVFEQAKEIEEQYQP